MFNKPIFLLAMFLFFSSSVVFSDQAAKNAGKVVVHSSTTCASQELQLNGFGARKKLFIKLYVASLYVQDKTSEASSFLEMTQASCIRLHITSSKITSEKMIKATREGFENATQGNTAPIEAEIETFLSHLKQPIHKGDVFEFAFTPHNAIHVAKNNKKLGVIENKEFATALFGIWLGDMPAQLDLKDKLLGN